MATPEEYREWIAAADKRIMAAVTHALFSGATPDHVRSVVDATIEGMSSSVLAARARRAAAGDTAQAA